ncbi:MAG: hypothetical protein GPJ54_09025 [Candidatus Heimdallarchaeota archaeon]|nr:hypothetical protein [Candidatus Heimdallarchaeota archaeon]
MEPWVHQQIKNANLIDLQTINKDNQIFSVPCLINYEKGILFLHPLRSYDQSYINVNHNEKASIHIQDHNRTLNPTILLKGKLNTTTFNEKWNLLRRYWINIFPFLQTYFDLQERYVHPGMDQALLSFKPSQIIAWENFGTEPIKIDMEIL